MAEKNSPTERLKELVNGPEATLDLAEAALVIAQEEYTDLHIVAYLRRLDELAETVRARSAPDAPPENIIATMNRLLFKEQGFSGNANDYYDARNSFLNEVLDRRLGIPITLSILYMEVGWRLGLPLEGISFPGHFLVKLPLKRGEVVLDPYCDGISLSEEDLRRRLLQTYGEEDADIPLERLLTTASKKEILVRMLRNLMGSYLRTEELPKALAAVDRMLLIMPDLTDEVRDRGLLYERLECVHAALADFRRYLELKPDASDAAHIRNRIIELQRRAAALH
ncbi:MAG: SirB1 family protein [Acidiferrobacterales bacterium]